MNTNFSDDDIQFLGSNPPRQEITKSNDDIQFLPYQDIKASTTEGKTASGEGKRRRYRLAAVAAIIAVALAGGAWVVWRYFIPHWTVSFEYPLSRSSAAIIDDLNKSQSSILNSQTFTEDSIDGVPMRLIDLAGLQASVSQKMPADSDTSVVLITQGWDYYYDDAKKYHYLGDFVYNGKQLAKGTGRAGFVAVTKRGWQMGVSQEDSIRDYVISQGGSMFRQFALVSAGQICLKQFALKGKVHRRALARKPGSVTAYYVETVNKESLYDFAEALSDYGFIDAVYLTGADGTEPVYRDALGTLHGNLEAWKSKSNLLLFRKMQ